MNAYVNEPIPIIDLFAGPGGLGEGFSSVVDRQNRRVFKVALSIENDVFAHQTLTLRSFLRQFPHKRLPSQYYQFLKGEITIGDLYDLYPDHAEAAVKEAWRFTLGEPHTLDEIDKRITKVLNGRKNFVLIGGPPCQAYSLVGRARRQQKNLNQEDKRVYLYREYYRILAVHRPAIFVMENVKGILSSKVENDNLFAQIIDDLKDPIKAYKKLRGEEIKRKSHIDYKIYSLVKSPSYQDLFQNELYFKPQDYVIRAEDYGIPQTRHRVILIGVRSDLEVVPGLLTPLMSSIPVEEVINGLPAVRSGLSKIKDSPQSWLSTLQELKYSNDLYEVEEVVRKEMLKSIRNASAPENNRGGLYVEQKVSSGYLSEWFVDSRMGGANNHETRSHIKEDLYRYLFASCFAKVYGRSPKLADFPKFLFPKHLNIDMGVSENKFADRFRVQLYGKPSKTVTSHISKDGHYFIHPDPLQCRSMTVREAARIQTFPDNYFFCGPRTQQYHQVGNAVPPYLAHQIAKIVFNILPGKIKQQV